MYMEGKYIFFFYIKESIWNSYRIQVEVVKKKKPKKQTKFVRLQKACYIRQMLTRDKKNNKAKNI